MSNQKPVTHVIAVIDRSGSMGDVADDVVGGFNSYVEGLRADADNSYRLTVTLFNTVLQESVVDRALDDDFTFRLGHDNYRPFGMTALNDAIGVTLGMFDETHGPLADDERALFVVLTDGRENSSREWMTNSIRKLLAERAEMPRWGVIYLASGPEAFNASQHYGVSDTIGTRHTGSGTRSTYSGLLSGTRSYASGQSAQAAAAAISEVVEADGEELK